MGVGVQHCSGMVFSLRFTRFISELKCFSSSDDFTVQFVGHSGTAVASDPYRSFSCLWCFWWDYTNTRLWVGICGRFHFCNRTIGERKKRNETRQAAAVWMHWTLGETETSVLGTWFALHFHPPSRQMMTRFYKTIVDITIMCMFIAMCNLCVTTCLDMHTHVSSVCFTHYVLWHTWMQLLCLHFAEALFMGLEAKVCPFYGLFSWKIIEWLY